MTGWLYVEIPVNKVDIFLKASNKALLHLLQS